MTQENFINEFKRDFGYGRCEDVPEEMVQLLLHGEEDDSDDDFYFNNNKE